MKSQKNRNLIFALLIPILILAYIISGGSVGISLDFGEDALAISAEKHDWAIPYDQIADLELTQLPDVGTIQEGLDKKALQCGHWTNDAWGDYTLCITPKADTCIVLTLNDGSIFVLNYENGESTTELYRMFTDLLHSKGFLQ